MSFTVFYITHSTKEAATKIGNHLLEKKLIACFNILPIQSGYWWHNAIETDDEWVSIVKTSHKLELAVEKEVIRLHPYDTPCILRWDVRANAAYEKWIESEVDLSLGG